MVDVVRFFDRRQQGLQFRSKPAGVNLDFLVQRFACSKKDRVIHRVEDHTSPPFVCKFRRDSLARSCVLATANETGEVYILNTDATDNDVVLHKWSAHENAVFDICWEPHDPKLFTSSGDNSVAHWDAYGNQISTYCAHTGSVKCIDVCPFQPAIFASAGRDGKICIWDRRVGKDPAQPEITITDAHCVNSGQENNCKRNRKDAGNMRSVTSIAFQDENLLASAGVGDKIIKFWDLRKTYISKPKKPRMHTAKYTLKYCGDGCTNIIFDSAYKNLFASCTNSVIYQYDCHTYNSDHVKSYNGHKVSTYFTKIALSGDNQYLLSGSSIDRAYVWKVDGSSWPIACLEGHEDEVTGTAWHPKDLLKLSTCSDDGCTMVWKVATQEDIVGRKDDFTGFAKAVPCGNSTAMDSPNTAGILNDSRKPDSIYSPSSLNSKVTIKHFFQSVPTFGAGIGLPLGNCTNKSATKNTDMPNTITSWAKSPGHLSRPVLSSTMLCNNEENIPDHNSSPMSSPKSRASSLDERENHFSEPTKRKSCSISPCSSRKYVSTPQSSKRRRTIGSIRSRQKDISGSESPSQIRSIKSYFLESP